MPADLYLPIPGGGGQLAKWAYTGTTPGSTPDGYPAGIAYYTLATTETPSGGSSTAVTSVDGGIVTIGANADAAVQGDTAGTLNAHARGLTKATGTNGDVAVITDATGTVLGFLRGIVKLLGTLLPASLGQKAQTASLSITLATENEAEIGSLTETAPATDIASSGINGRLQRIAQRITSLIALFPTALGQGTMATSFKVVLPSDQSTLVVSQVVGTTTVATVAVSNTAVLLLATNAKRMSGNIINNDVSRTLYVSTSSGVTADVTTSGNTAIPPAQASTIASLGTGFSSTNWYGIYASAGTGYVTTIQEIAP